MVAIKAPESERTALLYGYLQGANVGIGRLLDLWCWQEGGLWGRINSSASAQRGFGDVRRVKRGGGHRKFWLETLAVGIEKSWCFGGGTSATLSLRLT